MTAPILDDSLEAALKVLAEPSRLHILRLVSREELPSGQIADRLPLHHTGVSRHLTTLKVAGMVRERRAGNRRYYRIEPRGLSALRVLLDELLDELEHSHAS